MYHHRHNSFQLNREDFRDEMGPKHDFQYENFAYHEISANDFSLNVLRNV